MPARRAVLGLSIVLCATAASARARASDDVPTFADRSDRDIEETDHTLAVLLNPLALAVGVYGGDVDFVLGVTSRPASRAPCTT
jgi:hypothetical protein